MQVVGARHPSHRKISLFVKSEMSLSQIIHIAIVVFVVLQIIILLDRIIEIIQLSMKQVTSVIFFLPEGRKKEVYLFIQVQECDELQYCYTKDSSASA